MVSGRAQRPPILPASHGELLACGGIRGESNREGHATADETVPRISEVRKSRHARAELTDGPHLSVT